MFPKPLPYLSKTLRPSSKTLKMFKMAEEKKQEEKLELPKGTVCHNCGQEIKPGEPFKKEDGTYAHQYEKGEGPRSVICEFC